jgi:hypothetical protein
VIIWSRWGILVLVAAFPGVLIGGLLGMGANHGSGSGAGAGFTVFFGFGLVLSGLFVYLIDHYVIARHLDKPRQQFVLQPLAQPITHPNGVRQTHQQIPLVHPETGAPLWVRPRSSLFFIPTRIWPYILAAAGIVVTIISAITLLLH